MAKEFKTKGELQKLVLDEAHKSGKCVDGTEVVITGPFPSREFTWDILRRNRPATLTPECAAEIDKIVQRLQMTFELSGD
jgi:hypothetical protein